MGDEIPIKNNKKTLWIIIALIVIIIGSTAGYFMFYNWGMYKNPLFCSSEIRAVIDKYGINNQQIEGCHSKSFDFEGKKIKLVLLNYGDANDCPSGCFFSHYCAIIEDGVDYPYSLSATSPEENILSPGGEWGEMRDESIMVGRVHPLTENSEFKNFLEAERKSGGEFRYCR